MLFGLLRCVASSVIHQLHGCVKASICFECIRQCQGFGFWFISLFSVLHGVGWGGGTSGFYDKMFSSQVPCLLYCLQLTFSGNVLTDTQRYALPISQVFLNLIQLEDKMNHHKPDLIYICLFIHVNTYLYIKIHCLFYILTNNYEYFMHEYQMYIFLKKWEPNLT